MRELPFAINVIHPLKFETVKKKKSAPVRINFGLKENVQPLNSLTEMKGRIDLKKAKRLFSPEEKFKELSKGKKVRFSEKRFASMYLELDEAEQALYRIWSVELENAENADKVLEEIRKHPNVAFADIDQLNILYYNPNDPLYPQMYGLHKIEAECGWDVSEGKDVIVAVLDTGVDYNHPDISANMWQDASGNYGYDFSDNDNNPLDYHGHGSHVAGTIAATGNNNTGVIGVAPKAKIMAVKIFPNAFDSRIAQALRYAVDNGAKVLNNSWGPSARRPSAPVLEAAVNYVHSKGGICVFAAGNSNDDTQHYSPANMAVTITVGATDQNDQRASFSNYGNKVDIAAPGVNILSLRHNNNGYRLMSGTSMSSPHVAGAAASLIAKSGNLSFNQVRDELKNTSDSISPDKYIGQGRLNLCSLLKDKPPASLLHSIRYSNGAWQPFMGDVEGQSGDRGTFVNSDCSGASNGLHVCGITSDGRLWHTIRYGNSSWQSFFGDIEGQSGDRGSFSKVGCAAEGTNLHVCGTTTDGRLWHTIRFGNGSWQNFFGDIESQTGESGNFKDVACATIGNQLHVCAITTTGKILHTIRYGNGSWQSFFGDIESQTGEAGTFARVACASTGSRLHVCGVTTQGRILHTFRNFNGSWQSFFGDIESQTGESGSFTQVACAGVGNDLHVCGINTNGKMLHTIRYNSGNWQNFFGDISGPVNRPGIYKDIACGRFSNELHVCTIV